MGLTTYMSLSCQAYQFYEKYVYIELRIYYKLDRLIQQLIVEEDFIAKHTYLPLVESFCTQWFAYHSLKIIILWISKLTNWLDPSGKLQ